MADKTRTTGWIFGAQSRGIRAMPGERRPEGPQARMKSAWPFGGRYGLRPPPAPNLRSRNVHDAFGRCSSRADTLGVRAADGCGRQRQQAWAE
jgi:hypothetical protein